MKEHTMIDEAIEQYDVLGVYSLFSGGHDSLAASWVASRHPAFQGVIHIDTGTGLPETRRFVERTCRENGWPLLVQAPFVPYESFIVRNGFPGPAMHGFYYVRLKERALDIAMRDLKAKHDGARRSKIGLVSGVRRQESERRANIRDEPHTNGVKLWLPLIVDWTAGDCRDCIGDNGLARSPVKDKMHMSGECFCGCYARPGEFREIEFWYPKQAARIRRWEMLVQQAYENQKWEYEHGFSDSPPRIEEWMLQWGTSRDHNNKQMMLGDDTPLCVGCRGTLEQLTGETEHGTVRTDLAAFAALLLSMALVVAAIWAASGWWG